MEPEPWSGRPLNDADEAERVTGFRPSLPPPGVLTGTRSGQGVFVGDPSEHGICFFWNTADHIYMVSAENMTQDRSLR